MGIFHPRRAVIALAIAACSCAHLGLRPAIELQSCKLDGISEPLLCGTLAVPEDRADADSRKINLKVVVLPALGDVTLPPLYDLPDGPGIAATSAVAYWASAGRGIRAHREVVLVDPRGTGGSASLDCPVNLDDPFSPLLVLHMVSDCRAWLLNSAELSQYTTAATIADLEAVRAALDHDRIDLLGHAYGTRVAQEYLRTYPAHVRAVALLGTLSPLEKLPQSNSINAQAVLDRIAQQCAADAACRKSIADVGADAAAIRNALGAGPVVITRKDGHQTQLEPGPFWEGVRKLLATTTDQRRLPWLLHQAAYSSYEPILSAMIAQHDDSSKGLLLSTSCAEDTLKVNAEEIAAAAATAFGSYRLQRQIAACKVWRVPQIDDPRPGFVKSAVPALLVVGGMDATAPVEWTQKVASHLPNARVVLIPDLAQKSDGLAHSECYDDLLSRFFAAGNAKDLDIACVSSMKPVAFEVPAAEQKPALKKAAPARKIRGKAAAQGKAKAKAKTQAKAHAKAHGHAKPHKKSKRSR